MTEITIDVNQMRKELGDLAPPEWDDVLVKQLYKVLMSENTSIVAVELAASGFKLNQIVWSERNPI